MDLLQSLDYGNGDKVQYTYDAQGRVTAQTYEDGDTVSYQYDNNGALATITDSATGRTTTYYYDFTDRLMKTVETGSGYSHSVGYEYDDINNLTKLVEIINGTKRTTYYSYDDDNRVTSVAIGTSTRNYTYDGFGRVSQKATLHGTSTVLTDAFTFRGSDTSTTGQIEKHTITAGGTTTTYTYTYDDNGNILTISDGTYTTSYTYDTANQLTRENNQKAGKTWVWTYDNAGNILSRTEYAYTTGTLGTATDTVSYAYGDSAWGDLLTSYDGNAITTDEIGNMLSDGTWTYTWEHGRELVSMYGENIGGNNDVTITYSYDANGMRTTKTVTTNTYHTHSYTSTVVEPTCTTAGQYTHTCDCGYVLTGSIAALGHDFVVTVVPGDTLSDSSYKVYQCQRCEFRRTVCNHDRYEDTVVDPTCTAQGYTLCECSCGYAWRTNYTNALGHTSGTTYCMRCGKYLGSYSSSESEETTYPTITTEAESETYTAAVIEESESNSENTATARAETDEEKILESTVVETHSYVYNGGLLMQEIVVTETTVDGETTTTTETLNFTYDAAGTPMSVTYNDVTYYYVTNIQGDVIALVDTSGTTIVQYTYDAWGNILSTSGTLVTTLGEANPLRYRGYVYDQETGLYYLQSRYYDPEMGRFINGDQQMNTSLGLLGVNMFTYCLNNPVNMTDYSGNKPGDLFATIDEAARDAALYMGEESFKNGWEYAVAIYSKKRYRFSVKLVVGTYSVFGYEFSFTYPLLQIDVTIEYTYTEMSTSQNPNYVSPPAAAFGQTLAIVHTHPMGSGSGITRFSNYYEDKEGDIPLAKALGILMYVYGPNGEMRKYDPATGKDILLYTDLPHSPYTPWLE